MKQLLLLSLPLILLACSEDPAAKKAQEAQALADLKVRMRAVAQTAADRGLIGGPACVALGPEGRNFTANDADLLPDAALWRFFEQDGLAVRRVQTRDNGDRITQFFLKDEFRGAYVKERYCFGRWAIVDIAPTPKGKADKRAGVTMFPFDVTLRLTKLRSQGWLDSAAVQNALVGIKSVRDDTTVRAYLPGTVGELPPSSVKRLDQ